MRNLVLVGLTFILIYTSTLGCKESRGNREATANFMLEQMQIVKDNPNSEKGRAAFSELVEILNGEWSFARGYSCSVFVQLGPLAAPAVPDLIRAASCGDELVEQEAVHALAEIGPAAAAAVDIFIEIIDSIPPGYDPGLKSMYAFKGLGNIGEVGRKGIPVLRKALKSGSEEQKKLATEVLNILDPLLLKPALE